MHTETSTLDSVSFKNLLRFSFPIFFSLLLSGLYGAIDLWMVGRFALAEDVSAVSIGSNFMNIVLSLFSGLTIGCTVELATKLASDDKESAGFIAGTSVRLFALLGLVFSLLLFFLSPLVARLMHTPDESLSRTITYLRVSSLGAIPLSLFVLLSGIFKALGNSKIPFVFVSVTSVLNVLLNYIFVSVFHIGTLGVALATLISECISVVISYLYIHKKHFPFKFAKEQFESHKGYTKRLLKTGLPIAFEEIITEGSFIVVLSFANTMGLYISAGVGIAGKILAFVMFIPLTFMQTVSVFSAFSLGQNNFKDAKKSLYLSLILSLVVGLLVFVILEFFPHQIVRLFSRDQNVIDESVEFLKVISFECLLLSISHSFLGFFEGFERTLFVLLQGIVATFAVKIPFAYYFAFVKESSSPSLLALSLELSSVVEVVLCVLYYAVFVYRYKANLKRGIEENSFL